MRRPGIFKACFGPTGAASSATKWEYEAKVAKRFGFAQQLELPMPMPIIEKQEAAN